MRRRLWTTLNAGDRSCLPFAFMTSHRSKPLSKCFTSGSRTSLASLLKITSKNRGNPLSLRFSTMVLALKHPFQFTEAPTFVGSKMHKAWLWLKSLDRNFVKKTSSQSLVNWAKSCLKTRRWSRYTQTTCPTRTFNLIFLSTRWQARASRKPF